jgi:hypothetical protein
MNDRHFYFVGKQINTHRFRNGLHSMFGCTIHISFLVNLFSGRGSDVDNMAGIASDHERQYSFRNIQQAFQVCIDHGFPVVERSFIKIIPAQGEAGIVQQEVNIFPLIRKIAECVSYCRTVLTSKRKNPNFNTEFFK